MNYNKRILSILIVFLMSSFSCLMAQQVGTTNNSSDSLAHQNDSLNRALLQDYKSRLLEMDSLRRLDSIKQVKLEEQLASLKTTDNLKIEDIQRQLADIQRRETDRIAREKARVDSLRSVATAYPIIGVLNDTIFSLYARLGSFTPKERAENISARIEILYDDDFMNPDSLYIAISENYRDIMYQDKIIMSVTETDAIWNNASIDEVAQDYLQRIQTSIKNARTEKSLPRLLTRIGLVILTLVVLISMIFGVNKLFRFLNKYIQEKKKHWFKNLKYRDYTYLSAEQEIKLVSKLFNFLRWVTIIVLLFLVIPIIFSIFPFTRGWADMLFGMIWKPVRKMLFSFWNYLPNLFTILIIYIVFKYLVRLIRYFFKEIESGKLKISGFHKEWALPTFTIIRVLLYAFAFIMIFPYLPGSDSPIFKGVSVFLGLLVSLGSSSAIANMVAGLVITYMRPFAIGDRIKINDISGDVIEKTILVTRLKTITNEEITIPNSAILTGNTINYSRFEKNPGLILSTIATIAYDVPWKKAHEMLIEAGLRCKDVLREPKPYVIQSALNEFYASYKIHVYINDAKLQLKVLSELHGHIQDVCNENGIELILPHYLAHRTAQHMVMNPEYIPKGYKGPAFDVKVNIEDKSDGKSKSK
ncbi:MAG TPA: mechanosensitive ion channel family protein [Bacteroidales bacterium]|jgi:small-conductance mechanosensitive channel|nr:mechanosensitive ion channel family protein [Bacteroidales bacterium]